MKKYINKGLIFEWFNSSKIIMILSLIIFGYFSHESIEENISRMRGDIYWNFNNSYFSDLTDFYVLIFIFLMIHFIAQGINKRNKEMFLSCSPYTKKQIRYNELLCLIITINLFVIMYLYMCGMSYYCHSELISIIHGYGTIVLFNVFRIYMLGIIGILAMLIITSMFSNGIVGLIAMITVIPLSFIMIIYNIAYLVHKLYDDVSLASYIYGENQKYLLLEHVELEQLTSFNIMIALASYVIIMIILFIVYNIAQKINNLEYSTKIFTSKISEKLIKALTSLGFTCFILSMIIEALDQRTGQYNSLSLFIYIPSLLIGTFVVHKVLGKVIKKVN